MLHRVLVRLLYPLDNLCTEYGYIYYSISSGRMFYNHAGSAAFSVVNHILEMVEKGNGLRSELPLADADGKALVMAQRESMYGY